MVTLADRPLLLLGSLMIEAAIGYPSWLYACIGHPVGWVGRWIAALDARWSHGAYRQGTGVVTALSLLLIGGGAGFAIEWCLRGAGWTGVAIVVLIATTGLAQRSLYDHVAAVARPLATGDWAQARTALSMVVGRDTATLDEGGIAAAATETLAESLCDGVVAPAFWFLILGLPGLFAFKCISTADSMIGHMDDRYRDFGWASARADDVTNWVPARIAGALICLAGAGGWRIVRRDAQKHLSPNSGWPESAMAGVVGVTLGGGAAYDGEWISRATLGDGPRPMAADLGRALRVYARACILLWGVVASIAGGTTWLR